MKKISVIMSTYNTDKKMLIDSIKSILNQTYSNFEFIIVCDGDEEEYKFLKTISDKRIILLKNKKNMGLPYSLNLAIEKASGDYIARMDSDDISLPDRFKVQVEFLENNPDISLCATYGIAFGNSKRKLKLFFYDSERLKIQLLYRSSLIHPTVMGKSEVFKNFKYNEKYICSQDFELWSRISNHYKIAIIPSYQFKYRIHNKRISEEKKQLQKQLSKSIIKENSKKITGKFDEKVFRCLCVLGEKEQLTKENYLDINDDINYIISQNKVYKNYDNKQLKQVFYNRYFELIIKNKIIPFNFSVINKCFNFYNLKDLIFKII